jgi:hypothetical protein
LPAKLGEGPRLRLPRFDRMDVRHRESHPRPTIAACASFRSASRVECKAYRRRAKFGSGTAHMPDRHGSVLACTRNADEGQADLRRGVFPREVTGQEDSALAGVRRAATVVAARTNATTCRERAACGHATTRVLGGASMTGTACTTSITGTGPCLGSAAGRRRWALPYAGSASVGAGQALSGSTL